MSEDGAAVMDERRDLVDRKELRRRIKANESAYDAWSYRNAMHLLDAMPAVECPRGWTRGEVLAELDADPDAVCEWLSPDVNKWYPVNDHRIGQWHPEVRRYDVRVVRVAPEPEWVPLTQLVGRTIVGEELPVMEVVPPSHGLKNLWRWKDRAGSSVSYVLPVNLETGRVAVQPKAAT